MYVYIYTVVLTYDRIGHQLKHFSMFCVYSECVRSVKLFKFIYTKFVIIHRIIDFICYMHFIKLLVHTTI